MSFSRIIEEVREHPVLWSRRDARSNRHRQTHIWRVVAAKLRMDEKLLRKRWKHLKDQYRKELKKAAETNQPSPWRYFEELEFISQEIRFKEHAPAEEPYPEELPESATSTVEDSTVGGNNISVLSSKISRLSDFMQRHVKALQRDPDELYLLSLVPMLQRLTCVQKLQFRGKVNEWLLDAITQSEADCAEVHTQLFVQTEMNTSGDGDNLCLKLEGESVDTISE
ncbi:uncharacterized protein LOC119693649 [Plutella xylostella]|uniref:uncharacterized protein LOC119693649 n=1 Tax=Plutella xylostella TaxID=51655 RepID=UPI002032D1F6|nr:uncharacterized protein LOC119693649 [Plutella xylostella]